MESRGIIRNILVGLVALGVLILLIVLIVRIFSGGPSNVAKDLNITEFSGRGAVVSVLADEPTNIDQEHHQVLITVSESQNTIETFNGYERSVRDTRTYSNNQTAFDAFLQTLALLGYSRGNDLKTNYQGYCPTGERYVFTFNDGTTDRFKRWAASCTSAGTFKGQTSAILQQFRLQIPVNDYQELTHDISIGF